MWRRGALSSNFQEGGCLWCRYHIVGLYAAGAEDGCGQALSLLALEWGLLRALSFSKGSGPGSMRACACRCNNFSDASWFFFCPCLSLDRSCFGNTSMEWWQKLIYVSLQTHSTQVNWPSSFKNMCYTTLHEAKIFKGLHSVHPNKCLVGHLTSILYQIKPNIFWNK